MLFPHIAEPCDKHTLYHHPQQDSTAVNPFLWLSNSSSDCFQVRPLVLNIGIPCNHPHLAGHISWSSCACNHRIVFLADTFFFYFFYAGLVNPPALPDVSSPCLHSTIPKSVGATSQNIFCCSAIFMSTPLTSRSRIVTGTLGYASGTSNSKLAATNCCDASPAVRGTAGKESSHGSRFLTISSGYVY
jgi:hypothetical protein